MQKKLKMKPEAEILKKLVEESLEDSSLFLVDIKISRATDGGKVKIIIDGDHGVSIDQCAELSRKISRILDNDETSEGPFILEVTSPGFEHPIQLYRQYAKNVGRKVKIVMKDNSITKGILAEVNNDSVKVETNNDSKKTKAQMVEIPFAEILKTNIQVSFK